MKPIKLFDKPTVDLHSTGILLNRGQFKGSGLNMISGKEGNGLVIIDAYKEKNYAKIEAYIKQEAAEYNRLLVWLVANMPRVLGEFRVSLI